MLGNLKAIYAKSNDLIKLLIRARSGHYSRTGGGRRGARSRRGLSEARMFRAGDARILNTYLRLAPEAKDAASGARTAR